MKLDSKFLKKAVFILLVILCLFPFVEPPVALLAGFILSFTIGHPYLHLNSKATKILLQASVVGLGFGMNLFEAMEAGKEGLIFTVSSIVLTLGFGLLLGKLFHISKKTSVLVSSGTAICGGSAIAAMVPIIDANEEETSVSLGVIFVLNSVALFIFPVIGHLLSMTQEQFGLWSAIAIHDTSSVVGAAHKYGEEALKIATTIKLERALWIIPLSFVTALLYRKGKVSIPYFIFLYVIAMVINTFVPAIQYVSPAIVMVAKRGLTLTLFLIGAGLSKEALKNIGIKPLLQGIILWVFISVMSLVVILNI
ncbi:putative integral membrane protein (TIGR00698 family) [Dysgonomonas alginatilytica]|uniref:Putative integral membrane protein (TIGR00698 family) n=1 Tax=Dysgonomonas alginatilytica TaxID=1605892 RepID=A0A2V3PU06_9BACT|nr:putative sulfate exporter family transporter [Dysgonomonas alginatilytica]PXV67387.1 putative integral membrane protein (TIGR00698 family) [Dysgonomonas alginatilytica]